MVNFFEFCRLLGESRGPSDSVVHGSLEVEKKLVFRDGFFFDLVTGRRLPSFDERRMREVVGGPDDTYTMYASLVVEASYDYRNDSPDPQDGPHESFSYRDFYAEEFEIQNDSNLNLSMRLTGGDLGQLVPWVFGIDPSLESYSHQRARRETVYVVGYEYEGGDVEVSLA